MNFLIHVTCGIIRTEQPSGNFSGVAGRRGVAHVVQTVLTGSHLGDPLFDGLGGHRDVDSDLLEVLRNSERCGSHLRNRGRVGQFGVKTIGNLRLSELCASLLHVEGVNGEIGLERAGLIDADLATQLIVGFDSGRNLASALEDRVDDGLAVDSVSDCLTDVNVIEGGNAFIEGQPHEGTVGFGQDLHSVDRFKLRKLIRRELSRDVDLTALLSEKTRVFIREEIKLDGLRGRISTPPGSAFLKNCLRVGLERCCLVGASPHDQVLG